jgi:OOP family OmpA-OmpF porin
MRKLALLPLLAIALSAQAASLPPWVGFPPQFKSDEAYEVVESFGREEFPMPNDKPAITVEGKHYAAGMRSEPGLDDNATWVKLRPSLLAAGWKVVNDSGTKVLRMQTPHDAWLKLDIFGSDDVRVSMIEVAAQTVALKLPPPAATKESVADDADFPFLGRPPGSQLKETQTDDGPMDVTTENDKEVQLAGTGTVVKFYTIPQGMSVHQFVTVYRNALSAAGWAIAHIKDGSDGVVLAHFGRNGRDVWASLHIGGDDISMRVADAGTSSELAKELDRACHVPLYGIHFDFNKATLRPDSEPALEQVLSLLKSAPSLNIEVQGHTDAVGNDAANQKLSEARAGAVREWLTAHGVAPARVSAKGYGKTHPVASNDNDEGRARNRRVEIAKVSCH